MRLDFEEILGSKPYRYGRDLLKRLEVRGHYVDENEVADFLGLEIIYIEPADYFGNQELNEILGTACAHLFRKENLILIKSDMPAVRRRLSAFHEFSHEIIPTHSGNIISCSEKDINLIAHKWMEWEAFQCGAEIMYPLKPFEEDSLSLELGLKSVKLLAKKYNGSVEATAIRYTQTNQNIMAIVVVRPNDPPKLRKTGKSAGGQIDLCLNDIRDFKPKEDTSEPLKVQYFVPSYRFSKFIRVGTKISEDNIIFEAWKKNVTLEGELPASALGSREYLKYFAECMPLYGDNRVMVLLQYPDKQRKFFRGEKHESSSLRQSLLRKAG